MEFFAESANYIIDGIVSSPDPTLKGGKGLVSRAIRILRVRVGGARKGNGEGEEYVWCISTGFCALAPECWRHQSDCSKRNQL